MLGATLYYEGFGSQKKYSTRNLIPYVDFAVFWLFRHSTGAVNPAVRLPQLFIDDSTVDR